MRRHDVRGSVAAIVVVMAVLYTATTRMQPARIAPEQQSRMAGALASSSSSSPELPILNATECGKRLDAMDQVFDYQRDARQKLYAESRAPTDLTTLFDPYEPEAVCLTEERFGGTYRYGSLGDGPKFVCGMETLDRKDCLVYNVSTVR